MYICTYICAQLISTYVYVYVVCIHMYILYVCMYVRKYMYAVCLSLPFWCRGFNMLHLHLITKLSSLVRVAVKGALPEEVCGQVDSCCQCVCVCMRVCTCILS